MVIVNLRLVLLLAGIMGGLYLFGRLYRPDTFLARLLTSLLTGLVLLLCWNVLMPPHRLGINPLSMVTAGALGLPGVCFLLLLKVL